MSMFIAWMGLLAFGIVSVGSSAILKSVNNQSDTFRDIAIREEVNRNRSQDRERFRK